MKNIRALIDTNIILDWIMTREPFFVVAKQVMEECMIGNTIGYLASHTLSDLFYILRKNFSVQERKELLLLLCNRFHIIPEDENIMVAALNNNLWSDFEDGLQMQCALDKELDYIVTRNIQDFGTSEIAAITSEDFISLVRGI